MITFSQERTIKCSGGNCTSNNLIYGAQCSHCGVAYIGKTVQPLRNRISQHRSKIGKLGTSTLDVNDDNSLAAHLKHEHNLTTPDDFNRSYKFTILKYVSNPGNLLFEEQNFINKLGTLRPNGLNFSNPVNVGVNHLDVDSQFFCSLILGPWTLVYVPKLRLSFILFYCCYYIILLSCFLLFVWQF